MFPTLILLLLSAAPVVPEGPAEAEARNAAQPPATTWSEASEQFDAAYRAGRYQEALPFAHQVVELSLAEPDSEDALYTAYINLGATQFHLHQYDVAQVSYMSALELAEATQGISSRLLIAPLSGLAAVHAATDRHATALEHIERSLAVSRRADGLFNLDQLSLIEQSVLSRSALLDLDGVVHDRLYAYQVAERNYGYGDPRTVPTALQLAELYESASMYALSRTMLLRVRSIGMRESGGFSPLAIRAMLDISRSHRLQFMNEPVSLVGKSQAQERLTGRPLGSTSSGTRRKGPTPDRAGLRSAEEALALLRAVPDPPPDLLAATLVELGDWSQLLERPNNALQHYTEALTVYESNADIDNPLLAPRLVCHSSPPASRQSEHLAPDLVVVRQAAFRLDVSALGQTGNITVVESNMSEIQLGQVRRSLSRAIYSPRFEDGQPVATEGVRFVAYWYQVAQPEQPRQPASVGRN